MLHENGEFERIRPHLTLLECGIIFGGIPAGAISRKGGLIWGIPAQATRRSKQGVSIVIVKAVARSILMKIRRDCFAELILSAAEGFVMTLGRTERPGRPKRRAV